MSASANQANLIDKWHDTDITGTRFLDRLIVKDLVYKGMIMELSQYGVTAEYLPDFTESISPDTRSTPILMERGYESDDFEHTVFVLNDVHMNCGIFSEEAWNDPESIEALKSATAVGFADEVWRLKLSMSDEEQNLQNMGHIILNMGEVRWDYGFKKAFSLRDWQALCKIRKRQPTVAEMANHTIETSETAGEHLETVLKNVRERVKHSQNARFSFVVIGSSAERVTRNWLYQCMGRPLAGEETKAEVEERLIRRDIFRRLVSIAWVDTVPETMPGRSMENGPVGKYFGEWLRTNTRAFKISDQHPVGGLIDQSNDFGVATYSYGGGERGQILRNAWNLSLNFVKDRYAENLKD